MKKFIYRFLIWLLVLLALAFLADFMISSGLRKTDLRKYSTWNDIYSGELHPDIVAVGSSRVWLGYNTYVLDSMLHCNSHNLGLDGHCIDFQLIRYDTYRRYNERPIVVLMNVDCFSTFGITADSRYEREQFFPYIFDDTLMNAVAEAKMITWIDLHVPLVRYFGYRDEFEWGFESFCGKKDFFDGGMHKGFRGDNTPFDDSKIPDSMINVSMETEAVEKLDTFVKESCAEGIQVVFVKQPVYHTLMSKIANVHETDSVFESIARKYNVPILDYYNRLVNHDSTCFITAVHLNKKGSEIFTTQLCRDLDSLGLLNDIK